MSKNVYNRRILDVTHPDGRGIVIRVVFKKEQDFVSFLDKHFDKGFKVRKGKKTEDMPTVYLAKEKEKSVSCGVK